jgi:uncharacterized protein
MGAGSVSRPRLVPERRFPAYAYLPGRQPHPVRDPAGHSYGSEPTAVAAEASLGSDVFRWGIDLFNHGYYWEAHEAWETLWRAPSQSAPLRLLFKGLILLAAAGVKIREGKQAAAGRHAARAAALFRRVTQTPDRRFEAALGASPAVLAGYADAAATSSPVLRARMSGQTEPVFGFVLGPNS